MSIPLLILSDSPSVRSGLGRIARELAVHLISMPEFRVAVLGKGGIGSRQVPVTQYVYPEASHDWGQGCLELAWKDFAGGDTGILFTINDASRLSWLSHPQGGDTFLTSGRFKKVGYFPVDATGPGNKLSQSLSSVIGAFDTALAYTAWGAEIIGNSIGRPVDWIPHGYNGDIFKPRGRDAGRMALGFDKDDLLIGVNMTNQARKDWGLTFAALSAVKQKHPNLKVWAHTDALDRYWSLPSLAMDFGLADCCHVTLAGSKTDVELSFLYSACDLTILPSLGEGFGFPLVESMACGVPVIHGNYAGGAELLPRADWLVEPRSWRLDTPYNLLRPVYEPGDWVIHIESHIKEQVRPEECTAAVEFLQWKNLWPGAWRKFFESLL